MLILLLYGSYGFAEWRDDHECSVIQGGMARHFRISNSRVWEYFEWAQECGYITDLHHEGRRIVFKMPPPQRWRAQA
jgi:hypothetical protein